MYIGIGIYFTAIVVIVVIVFFSARARSVLFIHSSLSIFVVCDCLCNDSDYYALYEDSYDEALLIKYMWKVEKEEEEKIKCGKVR